MAKNNNEKTFNAVATQFIKYGREHLSPGDKFAVKESDIEELKLYAEIDIPEELNTPPSNQEDEQGQQTGGNGGQ